MSGVWEITTEVSDREFVQALNRYWRRAVGVRIAVLWSLLLVVLIGFYVGGVMPRTVLVVGTFVMLMVTFAALGGYVRYISESKQQRKKLEDHSVRFRFSEDGVGISSELGSSELKWRAFDRVVKYPNMWLLFVGKRQFLILPTANINEELAALIEQAVKIGSAGRPRCRKCGYDLRGQRELRCPECGTEFDEAILRIGR